MSGTSEDVEMLLAGLEVESIAELKRLVDLARTFDGLSAESPFKTNPARPFKDYPKFCLPVPDKPGWRIDPSGELWYSSAWLDDPDPVSSEMSRGAAERQPHGCDGQLQQ